MYFWVFQNVTVMIGVHSAVGKGRQPLSSNKVCATFAGPTDEQIATFNCTQTLYGRFLQIQRTTVNVLEVDEVFIFCEGEC